MHKYVESERVIYNGWRKWYLKFDINVRHKNRLHGRYGFYSELSDYIKKQEGVWVLQVTYVDIIWDNECIYGGNVGEDGGYIESVSRPEFGAFITGGNVEGKAAIGSNE